MPNTDQQTKEQNARTAYDAARRSLLMLAIHAIHEAFVASSQGMQLALATADPSRLNGFSASLNLLAEDAALPWLKAHLRDTANGLRAVGRWCRAHRAFEGAILFETMSLGASTTPRITPADVMEAVGEIRVEWVQEFDAPATVVHAGPTLVTTVDPDDGDA